MRNLIIILAFIFPFVAFGQIDDTLRIGNKYPDAIKIAPDNKVVIDSGLTVKGLAVNLNEYQTVSTGIVSSGDLLSINTDSTKFDVAEVRCRFRIIDADPENPIIKDTVFPSKIGIVSTYRTLAVGTWIGIDMEGTIIQQVNDFSRCDLDSVCRIGRLAHFDGIKITNTFQMPLTYETDKDVAFDIMSTGAIPVSGYVTTANGTDLSIDVSSGFTNRIGAGSTRECINFPETPAYTQLEFRPAYRSAIGDAVLQTITNQINTTLYDNGSGTLQNIPSNNNWSYVLIETFPYRDSTTNFMLYGQTYASSESEILEDLIESQYTIPSDIGGGMIIAAILFKDGISNLTDAIANNEAVIIKPDAHGQFLGGGSGSASSVPDFGKYYNRKFDATNYTVSAWGDVYSDSITVIEEGWYKFELYCEMDANSSSRLLWAEIILDNTTTIAEHEEGTSFHVKGYQLVKDLYLTTGIHHVDVYVRNYSGDVNIKNFASSFYFVEP